MITFDDDPPERVYPYRTGWKVFGCTSLMLGLAGAAGTVLVPVCCDQWRNGNMAFGALALLGAPCTLMSLVLAVAAFASGVRESIRPPLLRVTTTAVLLPEQTRGAPLEKDAQGNPQPDGPLTHPEEIPFTAIRWIRRETGTGGPGNDRLVIVHTLSAATLELQQSMMLSADFDELETVLRAAVPEAFVALPVPQSPPPEPT